MSLCRQSWKKRGNHLFRWLIPAACRKRQAVLFLRYTKCRARFLVRCPPFVLCGIWKALRKATQDFLVARDSFKLGKLVIFSLTLVISRNRTSQIRGEHNSANMLDSRHRPSCVKEFPDENHAHRHDFLYAADRSYNS